MCTRQIFRRIWIESKHSTQFATHERKPFLYITRSYLNDRKRILDIGAGKGSFIQFLGRNDIYALDGNMVAVENLKKLTRNVVQAILPDIPFTDNSFDSVHASHILEHLYPEDFFNTLKEINRVLKVGGVFVISSPLLWDGFYKDISHIKPYHPEIFEKYLCAEREASSMAKSQIGGYLIRDLIYRYQLKELKPIIIRHFHLFNFLSLLFVKLLKKVGIGYPHKTGYTIILEKIR
jgi:SAM-dependent methyltransferase